MKKFVLFALSLGLTSLVHANTINLNVSTPGTLNGNYAYTLGASIPTAQEGQEITSMTISFSNVQLQSAPKGYLYVDLLNFNSFGVNQIWDGDRSGDAFARDVNNGQGVSLAVQQFNYWYQSLSFDITLNSDQLAAVNSYAQDGVFDIGLDPDCFYRFYGSCHITCNYGPIHNTPDNGWTAAMLGLPLMGFVLLRRKLAFK